MSNPMTDRIDPTDDIQPEYDFSGGVRGKHYQAYRRGFKVLIHKIDGTIEEQDYSLPQGVVILDPDVRPYFPDTDAVNAALRGLIDLIPRERRADAIGPSAPAG